MSAPDPDSMGFVAKVAGAIAGVIAPVWGARTWLDRKLDKKANKSEVDDQFEVVKSELTTQRGYVAKIFDQMRENEQRAQDRHEKIMQAVYTRKEG